MAKKIEAEQGELIIKNETGDLAIIPSKHRQEVIDMINDGCYECVDKYVSELPKYTDYDNNTNKDKNE